MEQSEFNAFDASMMAKALHLAAKGRFTTSPNPNVGCVITDGSGTIVGQGWHQKAGTAHAEVHALNQAGEKARGATVFVTLEPCSHTGRTGPCADALVRAGVKRVVAAMVDPNPLVAGQGLKRLAENGIMTSHGLMEQQARQLNRGFIKRMQTGTPLVTVKLAASLDGKTALENGKSQWITSPAARRDVQIHRAQACGILTGSGTLIADNPSLNVRYSELGRVQEMLSADDLRQPVRIILDGRNQLTAQHKTFTLAGSCLVVNRQFNPHLPAGVEQCLIAAKGNKLDLGQLMKELGKRQINHLWVEAGGMLAGALLQQNLVDQLILYQAPKLLGDKGQNLFVMNALTEMEQAKHLSFSSVRRIGCDLKLIADINRT